MKAVILAGGFGTRLSEKTVDRPKPMVEVGGKPILWHIMKGLAAQGVDEFVVALGYKGNDIKQYFLNYYQLGCDLTVDLSTGGLTTHGGTRENWKVHLIETGLKTQTGGRIRRLQRIIGQERFMMTYGDGVSDVDIAKLQRSHELSGKLATVTAVRPPARFGRLEMDGHQISSFSEKPQTGEGWINGGFMVLEPAVFSYIAGDRSSFELEALEQIASEGQLNAYTHGGFWQCMDTLRDLRLLERLWAEGKAPWAVWNRQLAQV
ncbi:MAG: glucose-1-phosphate cytidylyltransferase [Myxococcota bacterium]|nr:glucose-1-phosphate cytidylyltransferase [Myxococcota bacterium]